MFAKQTVVSASLVIVLAAVPVIAQADPDRPPTGTFELGAGFSPYEGFIARTRVAQSSLFGTGHMLSLDASISRWRQDFTLQYATPDLGDGVSLSAELWNRTRELPAFTRQGAGGAIALQKQLTPNLRTFVGFKQEYVQQPITAKLSSLSLGMIYESERTTAGMVYEVADRRLGSDYNFDRMHAWMRHRVPLGPLALHLGGTATHMMGDVPLSERLFVDGVSDIRGYAPGALMPLGGTSKLSGRAELEVPLVRKIGLSVVGFIDGGGILDPHDAAWGASAGVGLVWRTPIGTLRFDWAVPLDGGPPRFLFGIGGDW